MDQEGGGSSGHGGKRRGRGRPQRRPRRADGAPAEEGGEACRGFEEARRMGDGDSASRNSSPDPEIVNCGEAELTHQRAEEGHAGNERQRGKAKRRARARDRGGGAAPEGQKGEGEEGEEEDQESDRGEEEIRGMEPTRGTEAGAPDTENDDGDGGAQTPRAGTELYRRQAKVTSSGMQAAWKRRKRGGEAICSASEDPREEEDLTGGARMASETPQLERRSRTKPGSTERRASEEANAAGDAGSGLVGNRGADDDALQNEEGGEGRCPVESSSAESDASASRKRKRRRKLEGPGAQAQLPSLAPRRSNSHPEPRLLVAPSAASYPSAPPSASPAPQAENAAHLLLLPSAFSPPADLAGLARAAEARATTASSALVSVAASKRGKRARSGTAAESSDADPKRLSLFHRFDRGVQLDADMWWSVTPEAMALQMASCCACPLLWDAFGGVGGNAAHFARGFCGFVVCSELSPARVRMAQRNVAVYGRAAASRVDFILGDFRHLSTRIFRPGVFHGAFLAPPWGGPSYQASPVFSLGRLGGELNGFKLVRSAARVAENAALFLPRNTRLRDIQRLAVEFERGSARGEDCGVKRDASEESEKGEQRVESGDTAQEAAQRAEEGHAKAPDACEHIEDDTDDTGRCQESPERVERWGEIEESCERQALDDHARCDEEGTQKKHALQTPARAPGARSTGSSESDARLPRSAAASPSSSKAVAPLAVILMHINRAQFSGKAPKLRALPPRRPEGQTGASRAEARGAGGRPTEDETRNEDERGDGRAQTRIVLEGAQDGEAEASVDAKAASALQPEGSEARDPRAPEAQEASLRALRSTEGERGEASTHELQTGLSPCCASPAASASSSASSSSSWKPLSASKTAASSPSSLASCLSFAPVSAPRGRLTPPVRELLRFAACGIAACPRCTMELTGAASAKRVRGGEAGAGEAQGYAQERVQSDDEAEATPEEAESPVACSERTVDMIDDAREAHGAGRPFGKAGAEAEGDASACWSSFASSVDARFSSPEACSGFSPEAASGLRASSAACWRWKLVGISVYLGGFASRLEARAVPSLASTSSASSRRALVSPAAPVPDAPTSSPPRRRASSAATRSGRASPACASYAATASQEEAHFALQALAASAAELLGLSPALPSRAPRSLSAKMSSSSVRSCLVASSPQGGGAPRARIKVEARPAVAAAYDRSDEPRGHMKDSRDDRFRGATNDSACAAPSRLRLSPYGVPVSLIADAGAHASAAGDACGASVFEVAPPRPPTGHAGPASRPASCLAYDVFAPAGRLRPPPLPQAASRRPVPKTQNRASRKRLREEDDEGGSGQRLAVRSSFLVRPRNLHSWLYGGRVRVPPPLEPTREKATQKQEAEFEEADTAASAEGEPGPRQAIDATASDDFGFWHPRRTNAGCEDRAGEGECSTRRRCQALAQELVGEAASLLLALNSGVAEESGAGAAQDAERTSERGDPRNDHHTKPDAARLYACVSLIGNVFLHLYVALLLDELDVQALDTRQNVIWSRALQPSLSEELSGAASTTPSAKTEAREEEGERESLSPLTGERFASEPPDSAAKAAESRPKRARLEDGIRGETSAVQNTGRAAGKGGDEALTPGEDPRAPVGEQSITDARRARKVGGGSWCRELMRRKVREEAGRCGLSAFFPASLTQDENEWRAMAAEETPSPAESTPAPIAATEDANQELPLSHAARELTCSVMRNSSVQWILHIHLQRLMALLA
ncbi:hypothetical protein BESB_068720 [Besnoitia besnoiti]|uniref:Trimethylguanosine synthase n=1 Tax=Besnoitia besnoiti TaxID=94643 RepID=A0A2A9MAB4_BESBE|nr:hypothetical protein BESB_068720 [Besnoitia besnoiti]PFH34839.1 hypothetical protein BESB_068720 [Besnoitia besnoiti]